MIILGLDQAKQTGFCVMDSVNYKSIVYGELDFSEFDNVAERNSKTKEKIGELINTYKIEVIGLEDTFLEYFYNPKTKKMEPNPLGYKTLSKLLGVLECDFFEKEMCYLTWKKTEWQGKIGLKTNKKREEQKNEGINFIRQKFNIDTDNNNISDAIMIAYATCIQVNKTQGKV